MDEVQTGQDTLNVSIGAGTSTFDDPDVTTDGDVNPDYTNNEIAYYFTGDMNLTGTKVQETDGDGYQDAEIHRSNLLSLGYTRYKVIMVEQHLGIKIV